MKKFFWILAQQVLIIGLIILEIALTNKRVVPIRHSP